MRTTSRVDTSDWPLLTRFYGISPSELEKLPRALLAVYRKAVPELMAQEMLCAMRVADFPYMEQADRETLHRDLLDSAGVETDDSRPITPGSTADITALAGLGIAVVMPPKKEVDEDA